MKRLRHLESLWAFRAVGCPSIYIALKVFKEWEVPGWLSRLSGQLRLRSWSHGLSPSSSSVLTAQSLELLWILCVALCLFLSPAHALSRSKINKQKKKFSKNELGGRLGPSRSETVEFSKTQWFYWRINDVIKPLNFCGMKFDILKPSSVSGGVAG